MTSRTKSEVQTIRHESNPYKYFHMMLNMADDDLNAPEYRLLGHYLRWAGHGGTHQESVRQTAKVTRMGKTTIDKVRDVLAAKGYLKVIKPTEEQRRDGVATEVIVLDRWHENIARYSKGVPDKVGGVSLVEDTCVPNQVQGGVPNQVDSEEPKKEEPLEESNTPAPIGTDPQPESVPVAIDVVKAANQVVDEAINKTRKQNPNQATHDELLACFGLTPETVTKTGDKTYWIATADLASIHFPVEAIKPLHKWCMAQNWPSLTVMAMAKYAGQFLVTWKQPAPSSNPAHKRVIVPDEPEGDPAQRAMIAATLKAVSDKWLVSDRSKNGR